MNEYFVVEFFKFDKWNLVSQSIKEQVMILLLLTIAKDFLTLLTKSILDFFVIVERGWCGRINFVAKSCNC